MMRTAFMKIMVIDGNSILNRAFYGVRQLSNLSSLIHNILRYLYIFKGFSENYTGT